MSTTVAAARCAHFGTCGGCATQDAPYEEQLARKAAALNALFAPFHAAPIVLHPSPELWYYRNKMEFSFGRLGHKELLEPAIAPAAGKRAPYRYVLEGTALGNLASQWIALGVVKDRAAFRAHLAKNLQQTIYQPRG